MEDISNQSLVFLIDRLNVTKLVGASPPAPLPLHFRFSPTDRILRLRAPA
jgi:hypothetical protein